MSNENSEVDIQKPDSDASDPRQDSRADVSEEHQDSPVDFEIDESGDDVESLKKQLAEAEKRVLLCQADLENFRRRKSREAQDQIKYASLPLISSLLEVVDNLERALDSASQDEKASSLREGVEMVASQLISTLGVHGCHKIEAVGQPFDPNLHEAIQMQPAEKPANTVIAEVQTGYKLHDRVVRPAKVIISTGPQGES